MECTLAIIKPDAIDKGYTQAIIDEIKQHGFTIVRQKRMHLSRAQAEGFYAEHKGRPFFNSLVDFMTTGDVVVLELSRDNAVAYWREVMGETDPKKAAEGTIRKKYGVSLDEGNATHGSDSLASAAREIAFFFGDEGCGTCCC